MMKAQVTRFALTFAAVAILVLATAAPAAAETQTFRGQTPFTVNVPCANGGAGEDVEGILKFHVVFGITEDGAGGFHAHASVKLHGVAIGAVTGDSYQLHADIPEILFDRENDNAGGSANISIEFDVDAIGMGTTANFHSRARFQGTMNANGEITMEKVFITETCN